MMLMSVCTGISTSNSPHVAAGTDIQKENNIQVIETTQISTYIRTRGKGKQIGLYDKTDLYLQPLYDGLSDMM